MNLATLFRQNGEGRLSGRIARAVVQARPLTSTRQLAEVVASAVPAPARRKGHPARRVFQALRIEVNDELGQLAAALPAALTHLAVGGVCAVISYHSGEDRLTKQVFAEAATGGCVCPPGLPCVCGAVVRHQLVFRGAPQTVGGGNRRQSAFGERSPAGHCAHGSRRGLMAPPPAASATATRRHAVASSAAPRRVGHGAEAPATRRAPLRIVPTRTRRGIRGGRAAASGGRLLTIISVSMVVVALLAVVVGQAILANGQVKMAGLQHELAVEQSAHRQAELADAKLETPTRIVAYATTQGHMVAATPIELPYVSLSVPLPTPKVTPAPAPPPPTTPSAGAGAPSGGTTSGSSGTSSASSAASTGTTATTTATTPTTTPTTTP